MSTFTINRLNNGELCIQFSLFFLTSKASNQGNIGECCPAKLAVPASFKFSNAVNMNTNSNSCFVGSRSNTSMEENFLRISDVLSIDSVFGDDPLPLPLTLTLPPLNAHDSPR